MDGMTGIWPAALGNLADPVASALRVIQSNGNGGQYTAGNLLTGQNVTGTGVNTMDSRAYKVGYVTLRISGNSASASLWASDDNAGWMNVTSWAGGPNTTATAQLTTYYPYLAGSVTWASGGTNTGKVYMNVVRT